MGTGYTNYWFRNDSGYVWRERYVWWPKRSGESNQRIWLTKAWYGHRYIYGLAGESPIRVEQWLTDEEYIWYQLTSQ